MKNYEEKIDRLIQSLKDAKNILSECNIEMSKILREEKGTIEKYVLRDSYSGAFVMGFHTLIFGRLEDAKLFDSESEARKALNYILLNENIDCDIEIKKVKAKVV